MVENDVNDSHIYISRAEEQEKEEGKCERA